MTCCDACRKETNSQYDVMRVYLSIGGERSSDFPARELCKRCRKGLINAMRQFLKCPKIEEPEIQ